MSSQPRPHAFININLFTPYQRCTTHQRPTTPLSPPYLLYSIQTGDYTGSAFIRHVFYAVAAPYTDFLGVTPTTDNGLYRARAPKFYQFLRDIEPYLYSATAGPAPYVPVV